MALTRITKGVIKPNENYDTHNINSTGVITATAFNGDGSSLTGVANTDFVVGTAITMVSANFTGNVSIAGTLTYEDVTNVDSVGIITARSTIDAQGDVSIVDSIVHTGDANTKLRFPAADTITAETNGSERLRITSDGKIGINSATPTTTLDVIESSTGRTWTPTSAVVSLFERAGTSKIGLVASSDSYCQIDFGDTSSDNPGYIKYDHTDNNMSFRTSGNEKVRIISDGKVGIGITNPTGNLHISSGTSGDCQLIIESDTDDNDENDNPRIIFKQDGGVEESAIEQLNNQLTISNSVVADGGISLKTGSTNGYTNAVERIRITSDGRIGFNISTPNNYELDIWKRSGVADAQIRLHNPDTGTSSDTIFRFSIAGTTANNYIYFGDSGDANAGQIRYNHNSNFLNISVNAAERMRIHSNGAITKPDNPAAMVFQCTGPSGGAANGSGDNKDPLHFDHVHFNRGMTISQNNARIQVPTTGVYFVSFMVSGTCTASNEDDGIEFILMRNGSEYPSSNSGAEPVFNFGRVSGDSEYTCSNTMLVSLNANDYVECALDNIGSSDATVSRGNFCVMLMG
tara:strand:- start:371 stop:2092 length:1722 start_codon:yes stop_codon:yes gene_type:complete